ncbi:hypothetical protein KY331_00205 [Candidatus Woesearchaeota archaeon]|nr:hypothetical protein [Candidatus Woesearchaeota archaeon]
MGIQVDFNPDLALRDYSEFEKGNRKEEECIPKNIETGKVYNFLKKGQRLYWLSDDDHWKKGEMPLCKTEGNQKLSRPIASIKMIEVIHFLEEGKVWTKGKYKVIDVFDPNNPKINFEACMRVK